MQGKTINGYTLQRLLGVGGMAEVWYAVDRNGKPAAVKFLKEKLSNNTQILNRFHTEADVMSKLDHPNIRKVLGFGSIEGHPAIIMEYLEGKDLKDRMKSKQRFTGEELQKWWNQLVSALNYTHAKGIVHRDIKPGNIFIDQNGNVKLLDFGIAKVRESIAMTQTGATMGTLIYMSPEQVDDAKHLGPESDAYSLAVSFVHLLTGKPPYDMNNLSDFKIRECIVYKPLDMTGVPADWQVFLKPFLEKDPKKRPTLRPFVGKKNVEATISEHQTKAKQDSIPKNNPKPVEKKASKKSRGIINTLKEDVSWLFSENGYGYALAFLLITIALFLVSLVLIIIGWVNGTGHAPVLTWLFWESLVLGILSSIWFAQTN